MAINASPTKQVPHRWELVGTGIVSFTLPGSIPDAVWDNYVHDLKSKQLSWCVVLTLGPAGVTSVQRKSAADAVQSAKLPVVVVADDGLVRGMVTAVSWLGVNIKAFSWKEVPAAMKHTGMPELLQNQCVKDALAFKAAYESTKG